MSYPNASGICATQAKIVLVMIFAVVNGSKFSANNISNCNIYCLDPRCLRRQCKKH